MPLPARPASWGSVGFQHVEVASAVSVVTKRKAFGLGLYAL